MTKVNELVQFDQNFDFLKKKGSLKKISYERRVYESVDVKNWWKNQFRS